MTKALLQVIYDIVKGGMDTQICNVMLDTGKNDKKDY